MNRKTLAAAFPHTVPVLMGYLSIGIVFGWMLSAAGFGRGGESPGMVLYLGRFLLPAVIAVLIVYCCRGTASGGPAGWAPGLIAGLAVVFLHTWKKNNMLSIVGGTILYMVLVVF